ncbi:MAG TPA: DnaB-like helicase C-terminal domain-containing protein [Gemmatimonadaceae bacterium]|nr:DnaB-like helicase C-terminal domain-containing protein [Gemmatimonadaceae bacterium]
MTAICEQCRLTLHECQWGGNHPPSASAVTSDQIADALLSLELHADCYVRWPWAALDDLYGGMAPGTVHYVVAFSGMGKSTFIGSATLRWAAVGTRVDVMPLEVRANTFRTYLACQSLGIDPGLMLSGDFWRRKDAIELRERVSDAVRSQIKEPFFSRVQVHGAADISAAGLRRAAQIARERGAEVLVVDHIDHVEGDADRWQSQYGASVQVNREALRIAQDTGLVLICMSQANQAALSGSHDHLAKYAPLRDNHVLNGGHKRQNATGMIGLYRPLIAEPDNGSQADVEAFRESIRLARAGAREPHTVLEPRTMGINIMKSRTHGEREGKRIALTWDNGRIVDRSTLPYSLRVVGGGERRHA